MSKYSIRKLFWVYWHLGTFESVHNTFARHPFTTFLKVKHLELTDLGIVIVMKYRQILKLGDVEHFTFKLCLVVCTVIPSFWIQTLCLLSHSTQFYCYKRFQHHIIPLRIDRMHWTWKTDSLTRSIFSKVQILRYSFVQPLTLF